MGQFTSPSVCCRIYRQEQEIPSQTMKVILLLCFLATVAAVPSPDSALAPCSCKNDPHCCFEDDNDRGRSVEEIPSSSEVESHAMTRRSPQWDWPECDCIRAHRGEEEKCCRNNHNCCPPPDPRNS